MTIYRNQFRHRFSLGEPYQTLMDTYETIHRYTFDEASGLFVDTGNHVSYGTADMTTEVSAASTPTYQVAGPQAAAEAFQNDPDGTRFYQHSAVDASIGSSAIVTGSIGIVFKTNPHYLAEGNLRGYFGIQENASSADEVDYLSLNISNGGVPSLTFGYDVSTVLYWAPAANSDRDQLCNDGRWHLLVVTQPGDAGGLLYYIDGVPFTTGESWTGTPVSGYEDHWVPDLIGTGSGQVALLTWPPSKGVTTPNMSTLADAWLMTDVLTASQVLALWQGMEQTAANNPRTFEGEYARLQPHYYVPFQESADGSTTNYTGFTASTTTLGRSAASATLGNAGFAAGYYSSYTSGATNSRWQSSTSANVWNASTTGWIGCMFKYSGAGPSSYQVLWGIASSTAASNLWIDGSTGGQMRVYVNVTSGSNAISHWLNTSTDCPSRWDDGNWHQVVVFQPADGTGVDWWYDGVKYASTSTNIAGTATVDSWSTYTYSGSSDPARVYAAATYANTQRFEGYLSHCAFGLNVLTSAEQDVIMPRMWAATGL